MKMDPSAVFPISTAAATFPGLFLLHQSPQGNSFSSAYKALPATAAAPMEILGIRDPIFEAVTFYNETENHDEEDPLLLFQGEQHQQSFPALGIFNSNNRDSPDKVGTLGNLTSSFQLNGTADEGAAGDDNMGEISASEMETHRILSGMAEFFFFLICAVGLCGNTLVIYVVLRYSKMQTVTNLYILNLAVADECFLIGLPFLFVTSIMHQWPFGYVMCKVYMTTTGINQFTSSAFLTVMSGDRYVAICHAVKATSYRTPLVSRVVALTTWMVSALLMAPLFMYSSTRVTNNETGVTNCNVFLPETGVRNNYVVFTLYNLVASFIIPLCFIIIFYSQVILTLRNTKASRKKNTRKKVTRLVLTVIIAYVICWLPYWLGQVALIVQALELFHLPISHMGLVNYNIVASIPMYCNSAINPILYAFLSDNFRKSFFKACTWCSFLQGRGKWLGGGPARLPGGRLMLMANRGADARQVALELEEEEEELGRNNRNSTSNKVKNRKNRLLKKKGGFKALTGTSSLTTTSNWPRATTTSYAGGGLTSRTDALTPVPDDEEKEQDSQVTNVWDSEKVKRRNQNQLVQNNGSDKKMASSLIVTDAIVSADLVARVFPPNDNRKQDESRINRLSELDSDEEEIDISALLLMKNGRSSNVLEMEELTNIDDLKVTKVQVNQQEAYSDANKVVCKLVDQQQPQIVIARKKDLLTSDL